MIEEERSSQSSLAHSGADRQRRRGSKLAVTSPPARRWTWLRPTSTTSPIRSFRASGCTTSAKTQILSRTVFGSEPGERRFVADVLDSSRRAVRQVAHQPAFASATCCTTLAHAASAFCRRRLLKRRYLAVDGIGEYDTTWLGQGIGDDLQMIQDACVSTLAGFCGKWCRNAGIWARRDHKVDGPWRSQTPAIRASVRVRSSGWGRGDVCGRLTMRCVSAVAGQLVRAGAARS